LSIRYVQTRILEILLMNYYDPSLYPFIQRFFLTNEESNAIIAYTEKNLDLFDNSSQSNDFWSKRVIDYHRIKDPEIKKLVIQISKDVGSIVSHMALDKRPLVPDTLQIVRWMRGYELHPHADKENPNGNPHPFPWRDFASVVYLNDDYSGGQIHWPNKNIEWKPEKGSLAIFPGTSEFLHGVREVPEGVRYTIASFYTYNNEKAISAWR